MGTFFTLLSVQTRALVNSFAPNAQNMPRAKRTRRLALFATGFALLGLMLVIYITAAGIGLAAVGMGDTLPALSILAGSLAGVIFSFMKAHGTLFGFADYDFVMSLPVARRTVVLSRLAPLLGSSLVLALIFGGPLLAVFLITTNASAAQVVLSVICLAISPLAPTAVAAFIAYAIAALSTRFRHAGIAYFLLATAAILAVTFGSIVLSFTVQVNAPQAESLLLAASEHFKASVTSLYPPTIWAGNAIVYTSILSFVGYVGFSALVLLVCLEIMQRNFIALNGALAGTSSQATRREDITATKSTPWRTIVTKEFRTLVGTPTYAFNCMIGYPFMIGAAVLIALIGPEHIISMMDDELAQGGVTSQQALSQSALIIPWLFAFCGALCDSAVPSISMEGRNAWLMATAPLSSERILNAKFASCAIPTIASTVASALILLVSGIVSPLGAFEVLALTLGTFNIWVNIGMALDAATPNFSWTAPVEIIKRGIPVTVCVIGGVITAFAGGALVCALAAPCLGIAEAHALNVVCGIVLFAAGHLIHLRTLKHARPFLMH